MKAICKIYARRIRAGVLTIDEVPVKYRQGTREAYRELFGEDIPDNVLEEMR